MSRSYTIARPSMPKSLTWAPQLGFTTFYNTGLPAVQQPGSTPGHNPPTTNSFGTQLNWGLTGSHRWKRDQMGLTYTGNASHYSDVSAYNGLNHNLSVSFAHVLSRHLVLNVGQTLQSTSLNYPLETPLFNSEAAPTTINLAGSPSIGVYDQGTRQSGSTTQLTWQPTSRTAVSMGSSLFFVSRSGTGLVGSTGYQSQAEVTRRYTRKLTLGAFYSHANYVFDKHVSTSDSNSVGAIIGYSFNHATQIRLRLGLSAVESQSLALVPIDPYIAQIIGQSSGIIQTYAANHLQDVVAEFSRDMGRSRNIRASYARGLAPGNGLILTSSRESFTGGYSVTMFRTYNMSFGGGFDSLKSLDGSFGLSSALAPSSYSSRSVQFGLSHGYSHGLTSNFSVIYQQITGASYLGYGDVFRISSGVSWGGRENHLW